MSSTCLSPGAVYYVVQGSSKGSVGNAVISSSLGFSAMETTDICLRLKNKKPIIVRLRKIVLGFIVNESRTPPPFTNFACHTLRLHSRIRQAVCITRFDQQQAVL